MVRGLLALGSCSDEQDILFDKRKSTDGTGINMVKGKKIKQHDCSPRADWRKLFTASNDQTLRYYPPQSSNGKVRIAPLEKVFEEGE